MKQIKSISKITCLKPLALAATMLGLTACGGDYHIPQTADQNQRASVTMVRLQHNILAEEDKTDSLSAVTIAELQAFLSSARVSYADIILLDTAEGVSANRISAIADHIKARGLTYGGTADLGAAPEGGNITLYLERHIVRVPTCENWVYETSNQQRNNESAHHGCATSASLAQMVADPKDLVSGVRGTRRASNNLSAAGANPLTQMMNSLGSLAASAADAGGSN